MYGNGFCIDEEDFRDYTEPKNKEFMEDVKKGIVPRELQQKFKRLISIGLEDLRDKMYKPPPPPYVPFAGQAVSLGGGPSTQTVVATKAVDISNENNKPIVNPDKPTTQVSIRLHNG